MRHPTVCVFLNRSYGEIESLHAVSTKLSQEHLVSTSSTTSGSYRTDFHSLGEDQARRACEIALAMDCVDDVIIAPHSEQFVIGKTYQLDRLRQFQALAEPVRFECTGRARNGRRVTFARVGAAPDAKGESAAVLLCGARDLFGEAVAIDGSIMFASHEVTGV